VFIRSDKDLVFVLITRDTDFVFARCDKDLVFAQRLNNCGKDRTHDSHDKDFSHWLHELRFDYCLAERDKCSWISAFLLELPTMISRFTIAVIASCQTFLLEQYSHACQDLLFSHFDDSVPSIQEKIVLTLTHSLSSVEAKILALMHTDFLSFALPCMVLDVFQSLDDSSAITACSYYLVASDEDLSHKIHQLDRLVERDKGLMHDNHHDKDCSLIKQDQLFSLQVTNLFDDILPLRIDTATETQPVDAFLTCTTHDLLPGLDLLLHADHSRFCYILLPVLLFLGPSLTTIKPILLPILLSLSGLLCFNDSIQLIHKLIENIRNLRPCSYYRSSPHFLSIFSLYLFYIQLSTFSVEGRCRRSVRLVCPLTNMNVCQIRGSSVSTLQH
jgi:hypothetical protein